MTKLKSVSLSTKVRWHEFINPKQVMQLTLKYIEQ